MIIIDCEQRSPEWFEARRGIPTASRFGDVLATLKSGKPSAARTAYLHELAIERLSGQMTEHYVNAAMQRGSDLEPIARDAYTRVTGRPVKEVGFIRHDRLQTGCSPDGFVGLEGLLEIKAPSNPTRLIEALAMHDAGEYQPQVQGQIWITEADWCDLTIFHPAIPPRIIRVERDDAYIINLEYEIERFTSELDALVLTLRKRLGMEY